MNGTEKNDRLWAMACHLAAFCGYIIPLGNIFGPLIIWAIKRDQSAYIDEQGKEALNFQITITLAVIVAMILIIVVVGFLLLPLIALFDVIMIIIAAIKTANGEHFRYPLCWRIVK